MKLSVVIPAHNEEDSVGKTISSVATELDAADIDWEIVVVDDGSTDETGSVVREISQSEPRVLCVESPYRNGFGFAVRAGLERYSGDAVVITMADLSDDPRDIVTYYQILERGYDCAFGSRFMPGSRVTDYPLVKLLMNRIVNTCIRLLFVHRYNDTTNAFKAYRREVIDGVKPLLSHHFNLTVEIPLKAVTRGYSFEVTPIAWSNRSAGESKLKLKEMGSRYLFIVLYVFLERHLSRGDYSRRRSGNDVSGATGGETGKLREPSSL